MAIDIKMPKYNSSGGGTGLLPSSIRTENKTSYDISDLEGLIQYAKDVGLESAAEKASKPPKLSLWQRLGKGLSAFELGNAYYQSAYNNASFLGTYWSDIKEGIVSAITGQDYRVSDKKTWKDVLMAEGWKDRPGKIDLVDIAGFAADVIVDPTTLFGGPIAKVGTKGLKLTGKVARMTPLLNKGIKAIEELFVVGKDIERIGPMGKAFLDNQYIMNKGIRNAAENFQNEIVNIAKGIKKVRGKAGVDKAGKIIGEAIETGAETTGDKLLDEALAALKANQQKFTGELKKRGLITSEIDTYMHHMLTPEAAAAIREGGVDFTMFMKPMRAPRGKQRDILGLVDETGKELAPRNVKKAGFKRIDSLTKAERAKLIEEKGKKLVEANDFIKDGKLYKIRNTSVREINQHVRDKYGVDYDLFEEDAFKAFTQSGLKSIRDIQMHDFLQSTKLNFSKSLEDVQKLKPGRIDDAGVKWVSIPGEEFAGKFFPEPIAKELNETIKILSNDEATKKFIEYYDKTLRFWKGSVTGWFPSFHTRNAIGGIFNNYIAGLKNPITYKQGIDIARGAAGATKLGADVSIAGKLYKAGEKVPYTELKKLAGEYGVIGQSGIMDAMEYLEKSVNPTALDQLKKLPQKVMGGVENIIRVPLFLDGLKKGMSPLAAAKRVMKYQFDYAPEALTAFEKNVMKRVIPFYRFTRANIPLQIEQLIIQPGKYAGIFKLQRSLGLSPGEEDYRYLPVWLRERFTIKSQSGYWSGLGLPLEEATEKLAEPLRGFGVSMSPLIKIPIEKLTGYNIFKDRRIDEDTYGKHYESMPKFLKDWLDFKVNEAKDGTKYYSVNPRKKYWLEAIGSRGWATTLRVAAGVQGDDYKNLINLLHTIRKYDYTPEEIKKWSEKDARKELETQLMIKGKVGKMEIAYPTIRRGE